MLAPCRDSNPTLSASLLDSSRHLLDPSHYLRHLKLAIVGQPACGKTALLHSLVSMTMASSSSSKAAQRALSLMSPAGVATIGMNAVRRLPVNKEATMTIFDMGGNPSFLPVHAAFVDPETVFLLVIEEGSDPSTNMSQINVWLEWMAVCAPGAHISPCTCLPSLISGFLDQCSSVASASLNLHFHGDCMFDATSILSSSSLPQSPSLLSSETNPLVYNISDILEIICQRVFYHRQEILETVCADKMDDAATSSENTLCAIANHLVWHYAQGRTASTYIFSDDIGYWCRDFLHGKLLEIADFCVLAQLLQQVEKGNCILRMTVFDERHVLYQWGDGICFSNIIDIKNILFMEPEQISAFACSLIAPICGSDQTSNGEISFKDLLLHWKTNTERHAPLGISPFYQAMLGLGIATRMGMKETIFLPCLLSQPQSESTKTQYVIMFQHPHAVVEFPVLSIPLHEYLQTLLPLVVERMAEFARKLTPRIGLTFDLIDSARNQLEFQVQVDVELRRGILVLEHGCKDVKIFLRPRFQYGGQNEETSVEKETSLLYWLIQAIAFLARKTILSIFPGMEGGCRQEQSRQPKQSETLEQRQEQLKTIPRTDCALVCRHCLSNYIAFFFAESQLAFKGWKNMVSSITKKRALFDLYLKEFRYLEATSIKRFSQSELEEMAAKTVSSIACPCCKTNIVLDAVLGNTTHLEFGPPELVLEKKEKEKKHDEENASKALSPPKASTLPPKASTSFVTAATIKESGASIASQATQSQSAVSGEENSGKC